MEWVLPWAAVLILVMGWYYPRQLKKKNDEIEQLLSQITEYRNEIDRLKGW